MLKIFFLLFLNFVYLDATCIKKTTITTSYIHWQWQVCGSRKRCIDNSWLRPGYPIPTKTIETTTTEKRTSEDFQSWCVRQIGPCVCGVNQICCSVEDLTANFPQTTTPFL
jgi:hypothetical protein